MPQRPITALAHRAAPRLLLAAAFLMFAGMTLSVSAEATLGVLRKAADLGDAKSQLELGVA